jgi:hypothetical protein
MALPVTTDKIAELVKRYRPRGWTIQQSRWRRATSERHASGMADKTKRTLYVPTLVDIDALLIFLHECAHVILKHWDHPLPLHVVEFEAEKFAINVLRNENIRVSSELIDGARARVRGWVKYDEARNIPIKANVRRWANSGA